MRLPGPHTAGAVKQSRASGASDRHPLVIDREREAVSFAGPTIEGCEGGHTKRRIEALINIGEAAECIAE